MILQIALQVALHAQQYIVAANDADSRLTEFEPQVSNTDYGRDATTSQTLQDKFRRVTDELAAFGKVLATCGVLVLQLPSVWLG